MEEPSNVPMDKLARVYRKLRDKMQELTRVYDAEMGVLKEKQSMLTAAMKDEMQRLHVTSLKTSEGTIMMREQIRFYATDWEEFRKFVVENEAFDLLEKRIAQRNMAQFLESNPDLVPPGLNSDAEFVVSVRKPS